MVMKDVVVKRFKECLNEEVYSNSKGWKCISLESWTVGFVQIIRGTFGYKMVITVQKSRCDENCSISFIKADHHHQISLIASEANWWSQLLAHSTFINYMLNLINKTNDNIKSLITC